MLRVDLWDIYGQFWWAEYDTLTLNSARAITIRPVDLLASFAYEQFVTQSICVGSEQHQLRRQLPGRLVVLALSARQHQRVIFAGPHVVRLSEE